MERGKYFYKDVKLNLPIYLEPDTLAFVESIATRKKLDISKVVDDLIKTDMHIAEYTK